MEHGKKICKALKNIRSLVAQANDIPLQIEECTYKGNCTGTCPKCEAEARFLEEALNQRRDKGLPIKVEHLMSEEHLRQIVESTSDENNFDNDDLAPLQGMPMPPEYWEKGQIEEVDENIHILEGDISAPDQGELVSVTMGLPAPEDVYKEKRRVLYKECQIAGITFHDLGDVWDELYEGAELALVREKDNKHDKYAIAVALADDYDGDPDDFDFDFILGYVPRTENKHLATMLDLGWAEAFECELSQVNGTNPYKGSIYMKIYMVSKDEEVIEEPEHLLPVLEFDDKQIEQFKTSLESKGFSCQRWGALLPDVHNLPDEGDKVVLLHRNRSNAELYLTHVVAREDNAKFFVKNEEKRIDDCEWFVLTNVVGPVFVSHDDIKFLDNEPVNKLHPEDYVSLQATEDLYHLIFRDEPTYESELPEPM